MAIVYRNAKDVTSVKPDTVQIFNTAGNHTWIKPEGCILIKVQLVGAGGGAAGYWESGGGGGYSEKYIDVTNVDSVDITVGAGGGYVGYYGSGGDGGTSSFGSYMYATGGYGANRNHQHSGGRGGLGSGGDINFYGGGGSGHTDAAGSGAGGRGGSTYFGSGAGDWRATSNLKNGNGSPGTGGPGSRTETGEFEGTDGEPGIVIVHEYYSK